VPKNEAWGPFGRSRKRLATAITDGCTGGTTLLCIKKLRNSHNIRKKNTVLILKTYTENKTNVSEQSGEHETRSGFAT
jgi:hypothetical protein